MIATNDDLRHRVLVVDDDDNIRRFLQRLLKAEGYRVDTVGDGRQALAHVEQSPPDLVLLDLDMPRLGGFQVCERLKGDQRTRLIPVIILTGQSALESRLRAWEIGADDFLTKPFQGLEVMARCRSLLRVKDLNDELDGTQSVIFSLARAMEAKNQYTHGHTERVTHHALALARQLHLPETDQETLRQGAALHDIGKIAIPDDILNKPGKLTAEEYEAIKAHPLSGVRIVEPLRSVRNAVPLIRWHHERLDGGGYPDGLFGGSIPLLVRVLSVADVYDALSSARPYRPALPFEG